MEVELKIVSIRDSSSQSETHALLLKDKNSNRFITVYIGWYEARSIAFELSKVSPRRPGPHDLFKSLVEICGFTFEKVLIYHHEEGIFYANIILRKPSGEVVEIDSRTSDAVILALKYDAPVFSDGDVFNKTSLSFPVDEYTSDYEEEKEVFQSEMSKGGEESEDFIDHKLQEMTLEELEALLSGSIESEDFELASKIHEEIQKRTGK